jgi:putative acetyltransferase
MNINIRQTKEADLSALQTLYKEAFSDEDLFPLVARLLADEDNTLHFSALDDGIVLGHIAFSACHASPDTCALALLGPLAVLPEKQRRGIGGILIETGLAQLGDSQVHKALVLGDPKYYGRFGFIRETSIQPAYTIPQEYEPAWQSAELTACSFSPSGKLSVPEPWQKRELWS